MNRREVLTAGGAAAAGLMTGGWAAAAVAGAAAGYPPNRVGKRGIGASHTGWGERMKANAAAKPPVDWIDYCHSIGLGGVEQTKPPMDPAGIARVRKQIERYDMRLMYEYKPPKSDAEIPAFEAEVKAAKECGAYGLREGLTQRRYEQYATAAEFHQDFANIKAAVARSLPILEKYKMVASIENHKGWRAREHAAWFKQVSSEYVRVHFDFGNNLALCEDPMETLDILLPYIFACHIKDMAIAPYEDGFTISEVPLGQGFLDTKGMVAKLRAKDPNMGFDQEIITRDPLKIPVFTDRYWATFDDTSPLHGRDLAHVLELVKKNPPKQPLPKVTGLSPEQRLAQEDENNRLTIVWARENLAM